MRNNSVLHRALPIVAAALGKKLGVKVVMQGQTACTNGNTIYLPALKSESEHAPALWGYLTHEAAHGPLHGLRLCSSGQSDQPLGWLVAQHP